jgi:superfamily II DNA helicase RecQ
MRTFFAVFRNRTLLLSATLPPCLVPAVLEATVGGKVGDCRVVRGGICRPNLRMAVLLQFRAMAAEEFSDAVVATVVDRAGMLAAKADGTGGRQLVVFCPTCAMVEQLSVSLNATEALSGRVVSYHAKMADYDREAAYEAMISSQARVCVATTAFGTGVDLQGVGGVLVIGSAYTLVDLVQQLGRCGRDGTSA